MKHVLLILALLLPRHARADDGMLDEFIRQCEARGGRVEHDPQGGSRCITDSGGGTSSGGQGNPQMNKAIVNGLGAIAFVLILPFAPMHLAAMMGPKMTPQQKAAERKQANDDFKQVKDEIKRREQRGRDVARLTKQLDDAEAAATDEVAAARARAKPIPFHPPKLVPPDSYNCTRAEMVMWYREGWPLEGFVSKDDYQARCGPFTSEELAQPVDPNTKTCNPALLTCGGTQWCCPLNAPLFNPCNTRCYRTPHDIFGATEEIGMRCNRYTDCGSNIK